MSTEFISTSPAGVLTKRDEKIIQGQNHNHLALCDETMAGTINLESSKGFKFMLLDILCGSISGIVNHCIGHPIE
jgi:hypothetical protein